MAQTKLPRSARRKYRLRIDSTAGAAEKEIARVFALPEGCIRLLNPRGRKARADKTVDMLLRDWRW